MTTPDILTLLADAVIGDLSPLLPGVQIMREWSQDQITPPTVLISFGNLQFLSKGLHQVTMTCTALTDQAEDPDQSDLAAVMAELEAAAETFPGTTFDTGSIDGSILTRTADRSEMGEGVRKFNSEILTAELFFNSNF